MAARFAMLSAALWRNDIRGEEGDADANSWFTLEEHQVLDAFIRQRYNL